MIRRDRRRAPGGRGIRADLTGTCRLDRCSRTSILGVSICGVHRGPSAGSAIGVGVTLSGVGASKFVADPMGPPAPKTRGPSGGVYAQGVGWPPRCAVVHRCPDIASYHEPQASPGQASAPLNVRPTSTRMNPAFEARVGCCQPQLSGNLIGGRLCSIERQAPLQRRRRRKGAPATSPRAAPCQCRCPAPSRRKPTVPRTN